jgi:phage terminase large subunit
MLTPPPSRQYDFPEKMQFLFRPARFKVAWGGRLGLKSWSFARALLISGLDGSERVLCARELQKSLDESVHKLLADQISLMGMNYLYDVQQAHILGRGAASGTQFSFEGLRHNVKKIKSYEGITKAWVEEAAGLSRDSWNVLEPTIRVAGSEIWVSFNPELEDDFIYQHFVVNAPPPGSVVVKTSWRDNGWLSEESRASILHLKATNYDEYLHVYEGHTKQVLEGAIFADELRECVEQERIRHVPLDRTVPVDAYFDLGRSDHTSIWFVQRVGFEFHVMDFYQNKLKHIDHYLETMQKRGYIYGLVWLPHDAKAKTLGSHMSIEEQVAAAGFSKRIVPRMSNTDKINAARTVFPRCYFDASRTQEGLRSLRHYQYEVDPNTKKFSQHPLHDWASDAADAFCYFAIASGMRTRAAECKLDLPRSVQERGLGARIASALGETATKLLGGDGSGPGRPDRWLGR